MRHGDVLFDLKTPKGIAVIPDIVFNNNDRNSLDSCIKVVAYFLGNISENRKHDFETGIKDIFEKSQTNPALKEIIIKKINFNY